MRTSMAASKPPSQVPLAVVVGQGIRKLRGLGLHPLTAQPVKGGRMGEAVTAALSPLWDRPSSQYVACPIQRRMTPPNAVCWVVIFSARYRLFQALAEFEAPSCHTI